MFFMREISEANW